jgi:hypothetical protein
VRNTPYQYLPSRVEQASIETYAGKSCPTASLRLS